MPHKRLQAVFDGIVAHALVAVILLHAAMSLACLKRSEAVHTSQGSVCKDRLVTGRLDQVLSTIATVTA